MGTTESRLRSWGPGVLCVCSVTLGRPSTSLVPVSQPQDGDKKPCAASRLAFFQCHCALEPQ